MLFAKTAILIEWNRIFVLNRTRNLFFWALVTVGVLNIVVSILAIILSVASCVPMQKIWMPWIEGRCFAREAADLVSAWSNLVVDLAIIILPQREIWKLHMPTRRKVGVSLTFSVGLLYVLLSLTPPHSLAPALTRVLGCVALPLHALTLT